MPRRTPPPQAASATARPSKFLFLASHGLLTPIAGIRWSCGRLRRTDTQHFSVEQQRLLEHIYANTRRLSTVFGSMVLLARNEDGTYASRPEKCALTDLITDEMVARESGGTLHAEMSLPGDVYVVADKPLLETVLQDIIACIADASVVPRSVNITTGTQEGRAIIRFTSMLELSFLQARQNPGGSDDLRLVVGGTPGLLLSLSNALAGFFGGSVDMHELPKKEGTFVITVLIPLAPKA